MKTVILDLDDTLFAEKDFVMSGFLCIAKYVHTQFGLNTDDVFERLQHIFQKHGRGRTFNILLDELKLYTQTRLQMLVYLYRSHSPQISLYNDAPDTIEQMRNVGYKLGIITDGTPTVQHNKIKALDLENLFDVIICTEDIGIEYCKPSIVPFEMMLSLLDTEPHDAVYIGDNVLKDFVGPNTIGMNTIHVTRAGVRDYIIGSPPTKAYLAKQQVGHLKDVLQILGVNRND
jgi:putative hydrolase of the HAD superfamily